MTKTNTLFLDGRRDDTGDDTLRPSGRSMPEGPYETDDQQSRPGITNVEMARLIEFIEQFENETDQALQLDSGNRRVRLIIHLVRNHLEGRLTTPSSLAAESGMSYGTATRAIADMTRQGLIARRPRTKTGKTYSLHPSDVLMRMWHEYARRVKAALGLTFGMDARGKTSSDYFFGASYMSAQIIPTPTVLEHKLDLGGPLRTLVHADPTFMAMHSVKRQFEMALGVGIDARALSIDRLREEAIANARRGTSRYDIIATDLPWFGEFVARGVIRPLDDLLEASRFNRSDFHPEALASTRYKGRQYGLPVQTTPELFVYREDLFAAAEIDPPKTTDEVLDAARRLNNPRQGTRGIAWNAARGTPLGHTFLMVMGAFGQPVVNLRRSFDGYDGENVAGAEHRPMFDSDAARQTAEYLKELLQYSPPNILHMSWFERARAYTNGEVAMAYCYSLLAPLFELDPASAAYRRTGYLPHPHGPDGWPIAPIGGYALAIPANLSEDRVEATWEALKLFVSPNAVKLYIENGSLVTPRFSVSADPEVALVSPLIPAIDEMARLGQLQYWPRPPIEEISDVIAIAGEEMHDMLLGRQSVQSALETAQARAETIMREHGHY